MESLFDFIKNVFYFIKSHRDYSVQLVGAFSGAFFAFLFILASEKRKQSIDRRLGIKKEHAYLERYFAEVHQCVEYNQGLLAVITKDLSEKNANLMDLVLIPIRQDISMKISDTLFINKIELYINNLKRFNLSLANTNKWKNKIVDDLLSTDLEIRKRAEASLVGFLTQIKEFDPVFQFHLSELTDYVAENRVILKKYDNWHINFTKLENQYIRREKLVKKELDSMGKEKDVNTLYNKYLEKLKKFGLREIKNGK